MGQQQLILLVLATVIIGIAIVVGIRAFTENSAKSNADAMVQEGVRMANDMQAWKKKPAPFGGQAAVATAAQVADPADFTGFTFPLLGYAATLGVYTSLNGTYTISANTATETTFQGVNTTEQNTVLVDACGIADRNIAGAITVLGGQTANAAPTCLPG